MFPDTATTVKYRRKSAGGWGQWVRSLVVSALASLRKKTWKSWLCTLVRTLVITYV